MSTTIENKETEFGNVTIERSVAGQPHKGKVLAAVQPHAEFVAEVTRLGIRHW